MPTDRLSLPQRLLRRVVSPGLFARMEAESRQWKYCCPNCGFRRSVWEAGGVRFKAYGRGKAVYTRCPECRAWRWFRLEKVAA